YRLFSDVIAALQVVGVRYVVIHGRLYADAGEAAAIVDAFRAEHDQIAREQKFGVTTIFELRPRAMRPLPTPSGPAIPPTDFRLKASQQSERLPQMVDGDLDTRWLSASPQDGTEWIQVTFNRPRHPSLLRLDVGGRSFGDYPREIFVECSID